LFILLVPCGDCFRLLALSQQVLTDASLPDELLFGRSGYLLALLFVRHNLGTETVPETVIRRVSIEARLHLILTVFSSIVSIVEVLQ